jgi:hypothetical protein
MHEQAFLAHESTTSWTPVIVLDVSLRGISFASAEVVIDGELRELCFRMPGSPLLHRALIHVVHHSTSGVPGGFRVGAKFEEISPETTEAIADFLSKPPEA